MATVIPKMFRRPDAKLTVRDGLVIWAEKAFIDLTGYPESKIVGTYFAGFLLGGLKATIDGEKLDDLVVSGGCTKFFIFTSALKPREISLRIERTPDQGGFTAVFSTTPTKLYSQYKCARDLLSGEGAALACYAVEPRRNILIANRAYRELFGLNDAGAFLGKCIDEIIPDWESGKSKIAWDNLLNDGKLSSSECFEYIRGDGSKRYLRSKMFPLYEKNKIKFVIESIADISQTFCDRSQLEEQAAVIKKQKRQLEAIIQHMSEGLLVLDGDGRFIIRNKTANEQLMVRENISESYRPSFYYDFDGNEISYDNLPFVRVLKGERINDQHIALNTADGKRYLGISGEPISGGDDGSVMGILCLRDITDSIRNENALKETYEKLLNNEKAEKEALIKDIENRNEFISFITHEFKTPLAVINSAVQAIEYLCKDELSSQFKDFLNKIKQNSFRQLRLVNNLLDITRLNAGRYRVVNRNMDIVNLAREITESVRLYAEQKNIDLEFSSGMESRVVGIDEEKFERIMLNLLSNAIKFTPGGKKVSVTVSEKDMPEGNYISVLVRDEGVGIPKEKQQTVFELFSQVENNLTRQAEGTGIGLSLVKKMAAVLGGQIMLESDVGKGSCFEVLLPDLPAEEDSIYKSFGKFTDSRLMQATAIEFSDIYQ